MDDEPVHIIRESSRSLLKLNRRVNRDKQSDICRNLENTRVTKETIVDIINKLKVKSLITVDELNILKNAIFDDPSCTAVVLSTHGALRGLVRELSGRHVNRQVAAAGCFCNLALGDAKACLTVAKAAGPYLITGLDSFSKELAELCAWSTGSLAGGARPAAGLLNALAAPAALTKLLSTSDNTVQEAAFYGLAHLAYQMEDELSKDSLEKILQAILQMKLSTASARLLFILSCHNDFCLPPDGLLRILEVTSVSIEAHCKKCSGNELCCELLYLVRTLANSNVETTGVILNYFESNISVECLKKVLLSDNYALVESLTWLLGNIYNCCGDSTLFSMLIN